MYGFNTLLGHLDAREQPVVDQAQLLAAHLVSQPEPIRAETVRLVTACKLEQLHHGGSGIHPASYRYVLDHFGHETDTSGCWASYGSGDVVPAAWWTHALDPDRNVLTQHMGDTITLINGHFFSTAIAIEVAERYLAFIGEVLDWLCLRGVAGPNGHGWHPRVLPLWNSLPHGAPRSDTAQLPISLRDISPLARALLNSGDVLATALEDRLSAVSANPLLVVDAEPRLISQNSYLGFGVTFALTQARQAGQLALGLVQRLLLHDSRSRITHSSADQNLVQPPKIGRALVSAGLQGAALPADFVGDESEGIEDVRDLGLTTARGLDTFLTECAFPALRLLETSSATRPDRVAALLVPGLLAGAEPLTVRSRGCRASHCVTAA